MKLFFTKRSQLNAGAITSGVGLLAYLACAALGLPEVISGLVAIAFAMAAVYTFLSILLWPKERKKEEIGYNLLWGQGALTILLTACAVLTVREWIG